MPKAQDHTQALRTLNYEPRKPPLTMARFHWQGLILNPQAPLKAPLLDLSHQNLPPLLVQIFGPLSFIQWTELCLALRKDPVWTLLNRKEWASLLHYHWNQRTEQLMEKLAQAPPEFMTWAHEKQMGQRDLQPLLALPCLKSQASLLRELPKANLSRNEGKKWIDLMVDLLLMGKEEGELKAPKGEPWLPHLYQIRHPQSLEKETTPSNPWPQFVKILKQRQGDRLLYKMEITYSDPQDLDQKLKRLKPLSQDVGIDQL